MPVVEVEASLRIRYEDCRTARSVAIALGVDDMEVEDAVVKTRVQDCTVIVEVRCRGSTCVGKARSLLNDVLIDLRPVEEVSEKFK